MVLGLTSRTDTPPVVTMASAIGRLPEISRVDAALFDDRRDDFPRQQLAQGVYEVAVLVLVEVGQQALIERFFIERRLEVDLDTVAFAAEMAHMCARGQHERTRQTEMREQHLAEVGVYLFLVFKDGQLHVAQAESHERAAGLAALDERHE